MKSCVELGNGQQMPVVGYGMWLSNDEKELEDALDTALATGYRHFDTAFVYNNEHVLGRAINRWIRSGKVTREELFIVTKIPSQGNHHERASQFLDKSLAALQLEYVDLLLLHNPMSLEVDEEGEGIKIGEDGQVIPDRSTTFQQVWGAMEGLVDAGKTKAIGISNYSVAQVERIVKVARIPPANNQVELNAFFPKKELRELCKRHGIVVTAYAPLGSPGRTAVYDAKVPPLLESPVVAEVAEKHGKSPAQVLLRHLTQHLGVVVVPKSVTPSRIQSNYQIFYFELDDEDLEKLDALDTGKEGSFGLDFMTLIPGIEKHPEYQLTTDNEDTANDA